MNRISISGEIASWGYGARWLKNELANMSGEVEVEISSYGGDVFEGVDMYNELKKYSKEKGKVTTVNKAKVMSIASLIFLAGDTKKAYANATIMIHKAWTWLAGNKDDLLKEAKVLGSIDNVLINEYNKYMSEDKEQIGKILSDEGWYIGKMEMEATGFVDEFLEAEDDVEDMVLAKKAFAKNIEEFKNKAKAENVKPNLEAVAKVIDEVNIVATMPSDEKIVNSNQGANMKFNEENFNMLNEQNTVFSARIKTLEARHENSTAQIADLQAALDTKETEMSAKLSEAIREANEGIVARLQEAKASKVLDADTMIAMAKADSDEEASKLAIDANKSEATPQVEANATKNMWNDFLPKGDK